MKIEFPSANRGQFKPVRVKPLIPELIERRLPVARWLPLALPIVFQLLHALTSLTIAPLGFALTGIALVYSARIFSLNGRGLGILIPLQLLSSLTAAVLFSANFLHPQEWLRLSGETALMTAGVSWVFNVVGSYLPR